MNRPSQFWLYWIGVLVIVLGLHSLTRWDTFSLVSWPLAVAVVMAFTIARPWGWFLLLMTIAELGSSLPPGTLAVACLWPMLMAKLPTRPDSGLSWGFGLYVALIVAMQSCWLTLWPLIVTHQAITWADVPRQLPAVIVSSALTGFVAIMVWREWIEPLPYQRTIPRYK